MFKISTKERFNVITPEVETLSANMTEIIEKGLKEFLEKDVKNLILNLQQLKEMDEEVAKLLLNIQSEFYENKASFVICELNETLEEQLEKWELLEIMNTTPTESEAWDIVQMEEIEREILGDEDF